jgi:hypothetical protein
VGTAFGRRAPDSSLSRLLRSQAAKVALATKKEAQPAMSSSVNRHLPETYFGFGLSRSWPCAESVMGTDPCTSPCCGEAVFGKGHHPNGRLPRRVRLPLRRVTYQLSGAWLVPHMPSRIRSGPLLARAKDSKKQTLNLISKPAPEDPTEPQACTYSEGDSEGGFG